MLNTMKRINCANEVEAEIILNMYQIYNDRNEELPDFVAERLESAIAMYKYPDEEMVEHMEEQFEVKEDHTDDDDQQSYGYTDYIKDMVRIYSGAAVEAAKIALDYVADVTGAVIAAGAETISEYYHGSDVEEVVEGLKEIAIYSFTELPSDIYNMMIKDPVKNKVEETVEETSEVLRTNIEELEDHLKEIDDDYIELLSIIKYNTQKLGSKIKLQYHRLKTFRIDTTLCEVIDRLFPVECYTVEMNS